MTDGRSFPFVYASPDDVSTTRKTPMTNSDPDSAASDRRSSFLDVAVSVVGESASAFVSVSFFCALAWRRDAVMVSYFVGSIVNAVSGKILKVLLNQERPSSSPSSAPSDKGMPSSHAMSLGFIGTLTVLSTPSVPVASAVAAYATVSLWHRVREKLHTVDQIAVGLVLGSCNGWTWRRLCMGEHAHLGVPNPVDLASRYVLSKNDGLLPAPMLVVPLLVGVMIVGSFERRLKSFLVNRPTRTEDDKTE